MYTLSLLLLGLGHILTCQFDNSIAAQIRMNQYEHDVIGNDVSVPITLQHCGPTHENRWKCLDWIDELCTEIRHL